VTIILEGVTSSCVVDQVISPLPDAPLTALPFLDAMGSSPPAAGVLVVSDGHELAIALQQPSVSTVYLGKQGGLVSTCGLGCLSSCSVPGGIANVPADALKVMGHTQANHMDMPAPYYYVPGCDFHPQDVPGLHVVGNSTTLGINIMELWTGFLSG
jgi:hypothetical protein